jgi:hypothetical protein
MAFLDDLDVGVPLCSQEHLTILFEDTTPGIMWDQYSVVGDVLAHIHHCPFLMYCADVLQEPFTHHFLCADIYKLLAPDLLHQLIKGTFKDHLVVWVELMNSTGNGYSHQKIDGVGECSRCVKQVSNRISVTPVSGKELVEQAYKIHYLYLFGLLFYIGIQGDIVLQ